MRPVESYLCESYRNCCWDPTLPEDGVCTTAHEGAVGAAIDDGSDPSRPSFCEYISGVASSSLSVGRGISPAGCAALDGVIQGFDRNECQAEVRRGGERSARQQSLQLVLRAKCLSFAHPFSSPVPVLRQLDLGL